ncbi:MAG TPA: hypothetical protein VFQ44_20730 [Streptosporangiaceae bacterium]|nr:hypothetical protein [Streptosporangiaceae bacterium]
MREALLRDISYADAFFAVESRRLRKLYVKYGNPRLAYLCGKGVAAFGRELGITGSMGLGILEIMLAEMLIASGASADDLDRAESHLTIGRNQLELTARTDQLPKVFGQWYMIMAVSLKARGKLNDYSTILDEGVNDDWMVSRAGPGDRAAVVRQRVMMRQSLEEHIVLLNEAHKYKYSHPLEYYRTLKRVVEFFANNGFVESSMLLRNEFMFAFAQSSDRMPEIGKVSFARDFAQLSALRGELGMAKKLAIAAMRRAESAALFGQVRQLKVLSEAIDSGDVRGALEQFHV